jgi:hypothetical protein
MTRRNTEEKLALSVFLYAICGKDSPITAFAALPPASVIDF